MINEQLYQNYLKVLLDGNREACFETVQSLLEQKINIKLLYTRLFQRSMVDVGLLWERSKISVAKEHLATCMTQNLMQLVYPTLFTDEHLEKTAIVTSAFNEYHQIGAQMVADIFEINGWHSYYLGANTPINDLNKLAQELKPNVIGISVSISFNLPNVVSSIEELRKHFPKTRMIVGGQAFLWGRNYRYKLEQYPLVDCILTLDELETYLLNFDKPTINETG